MMSGRAESFADALRPLGNRKSAGEHIFEHLKQAIIRGDIPPGSRMVETRIAETMGVSRTPVREAIHKLEREGFLTKQPNSGFAVAGLTREDIEGCFGIRAVLEGYAARLATVRHTPGQLKPLIRKIDLFQKHLENDDLEALPRINTDLHNIIYQLSGSPRLIKMINDLKEQILRFRIIILKSKTLARASHKDHSDMLAMMRERRAEEVELLVREHILRGQTAVLREYDKEQQNQTD
ncbi:MAG: GntR family transcriptional regulator [Desulfomonilaceae bacterium]|nr:GntR family transcriptional regulator [Desulfomonilaceae bacterium]